MRGDGAELVGRMDRLGVARAASAAGLPPAVAERVAEVVVGTGLPEDRRAEVFRELVAHFEDGLASGRTAEDLLAAFGEAGVAGPLIRREKRQVTAPRAGGTGPGDGLPARLWRDVRYAVRRMAARPAFTATAILSLALGIGANAAMFTLVNDVILRRPAVEDPGRLLNLYANSASAGPFNPLSHPDMEDVARATRDVFAAVGGARMFMASRGDADRPEQLFVELVTPNYFELLGVRPARGRLFGPADAPAPGAGALAVLTHAYWRRAFGGDPDVVGRTVTLNGSAYEVVGVAPPDFTGSFRGIGVDLFVPVTMMVQLDPTTPDFFDDRGSNGTFVKARLLPGASREQATVALERLAADFRDRQVGLWQAGDSFVVLPMSEVIVWPPIDQFLVPVAWMLMVVVGLVLVIACANLAAFLLARAVDRRKEIAVRLALGATRAQLVGQLLAETLLLALAGGALGVLLGRGALLLVLGADLPVPVPVSLELALDWRVLVFSMAVSAAAGVLFGLAPALQATRLDLAQVIRDESTGGGRAKGTLRQVLVAGQVAVSVVLLVAAGLFVRSFDAARRVDPGFGQHPAAMAWVGVSGGRDDGSALRGLERIQQRVAALPGVRTVGMAENVHLNTLSSSSSSILVDGVEPPPGRRGHDVDRTAIDTGFVAASGLRVVAGRNVTPDDDGDAPPVALVNEAFAARFWPGQSALGRRFRMADGTEREVVGVVNTARIRTLGEEPRPFMYLPLAQQQVGVVWLVARTEGPADGLVAALLREIRAEDPRAFVLSAYTMQRHLDIMALPAKLGAAALGGFALLALVMASIGLYGTVNYAVAQRTREVGIRLSLGAGPGAVVRLLLWSGLRLVLAGAAAGLAAALLLARLLQGLLFGVGALDPLTFALVPAVLTVVALAAAWVPARRAGRISPVSALRAD